MREYETVAEAANSRWSPPQAGIFSGHLEYAEWYAKWWALRMMDAVDKYNPDFIYTDGTDQQPFSGSGTGTGYKCDAMQRVIADFYNKTLDRRGKVDVFSIVKFRKQTMVRSILVRRGFRRISKPTRPGLQRLRSVTGSMDRILCIAQMP